MHTHILATVLIAATKAAAKKPTSSGGGYEELIFIGLIVLAAWLLFFRPRSRQAQSQRQLLSTLVPGDEVLTGAGIYGTVLDVYPDRITIETAPGTRMTVSRSTVARKVDPATGGPSDPTQAQLNGHGTYAPQEQDEYDEDDEDDEYDDEQDEYDDEQDEYDDEDGQDEASGQDEDEDGQDEAVHDGAAHGEAGDEDEAVHDGAAHGEAGDEGLDDPGEGGAGVSSGGGKGRRR